MSFQTSLESAGAYETNCICGDCMAWETLDIFPVDDITDDRKKDEKEGYCKRLGQ